MHTTLVEAREYRTSKVALLTCMTILVSEQFILDFHLSFFAPKMYLLQLLLRHNALDLNSEEILESPEGESCVGLRPPLVSLALLPCL